MSVFSGIELLRFQPPGEDLEGPIAPVLRKLSEDSNSGGPKSIVGLNVAHLIRKHGVWVSFLPTKGAGVSPWCGHIWLDVRYKEQGQTRSPRRIGLVVHELTHNLQRKIGDPNYWPRGGLKPIEHTRWIADSTNFMEVLAYLIGWVTEYDLEQDRLKHDQLTTGQKESINEKLRVYENLIATLTDSDVENAKRLALIQDQDNFFYKQNYRKEAKTPDGRVPRGGWRHWLKEMDFSPKSIKHIKSLAARGKKLDIDKKEIDELVGLSEADRSTRFRNLSWSAIGMTLIYLYARITGSATDYDRLPLPFSEPVLVFLEWAWWVCIGAVVRGLTTIGRTLYKGVGLEILRNIHWPSALIVGVSSGLLVSLFTISDITLGINVEFASLNWNTTRFSTVPFVVIAFGLGFHARLLTEWIIQGARSASKLIKTSMRVSSK